MRLAPISGNGFLSIVLAAVAGLAVSAAPTLHASVHVPYPGYGSTCVNDAVNSYLATGQLPAADLLCS